MNVFEMAAAYYPRLWTSERLRMLVDAEKLTEEEYDEITCAGKEEGAAG